MNDDIGFNLNEDDLIQQENAQMERVRNLRDIAEAIGDIRLMERTLVYLIQLDLQEHPEDIYEMLSSEYISTDEQSNINQFIRNVSGARSERDEPSMFWEFLKAGYNVVVNRRDPEMAARSLLSLTTEEWMQEGPDESEKPPSPFEAAQHNEYDNDDER